MLSEDHLKLDIVVSQGLTPSVLWARPGTLGLAMLWRGIRYSNSESTSMPPSLVWVITNILGTVRDQALKLPLVLGTGLGVQ
jgi:hypothetical protein